jgi:electron transport complex protein RnfG
MKLAEMRNTVGYQAGLLGVVALVASAALAMANHYTAAAIAAAEAADLQASLSQVLPVGFSDNDLLRDTLTLKVAQGAPVTVYRARKGGRVEGLIFQVTGKGYAGPIAIVMGVDRDGRLLGMRVTKHTETPGLGDKIDSAKSDWALAFKGKSLDEPAAQRWAVKKDGGDFDQFTGATITPRAVVRAVKQGLEFFAAHRDELLDSVKSAANGAQQ